MTRLEQPSLVNLARGVLYYSTVRRSAWFRTLVGIWGLWFSAALLEAPGVHACAVHSGASAHGHAHAGHTMPMPMASHAADHQASSTTHPSNESSPACTCLGLCCGASPVLVRAHAITIVVRTTIATASPIPVADAARAITRPRVQPFANGPPAAA